MSETTPRPWTLTPGQDCVGLFGPDNGWVCDVKKNVVRSGDHIADAELIETAVNAYDTNQQTIRELVAVCEGWTAWAAESELEPLGTDDRDVCGVCLYESGHATDCVLEQTKAALAAAKNTRPA